MVSRLQQLILCLHLYYRSFWLVSSLQQLILYLHLYYRSFRLVSSLQQVILYLHLYYSKPPNIQISEIVLSSSHFRCLLYMFCHPRMFISRNMLLAIISTSVTHTKINITQKTTLGTTYNVRQGHSSLYFLLNVRQIITVSAER